MRDFDLMCFQLYRESTGRTSTCKSYKSVNAALLRIAKQGGGKVKVTGVVRASLGSTPRVVSFWADPRSRQSADLTWWVERYMGSHKERGRDEQAGALQDWLNDFYTAKSMAGSPQGFLQNQLAKLHLLGSGEGSTGVFISPIVHETSTVD